MTSSPYGDGGYGASGESGRSADQLYWLNQGSSERSFRGDFLSELTNAARDNPLSTALIGIGVLWLFAGGGAKALLRSEPGRQLGRRLGQAPRATGRAVSSAASGVQAAGEAVTGGIASIGGGVARTGARLGHAMSSAAAQTTRGVSAAAQGLGTATNRAVGSIPRPPSPRGLQPSLRGFAERQPWALGAVGLAIGAGLGAALPSTESERRTIGQTSDAFKERAVGLATEQLKTMRSAAERMLQEKGQTSPDQT